MPPDSTWDPDPIDTGGSDSPDSVDSLDRRALVYGVVAFLCVLVFAATVAVPDTTPFVEEAASLLAALFFGTLARNAVRR